MYIYYIYHTDCHIYINLLKLPQSHSDTSGLTYDSLKSHVKNLSHTSKIIMTDRKGEKALVV